MKTEFTHVDSPQMQQIGRLASEAVISSSLLAVKGPQGFGKSHAAQMLARKWSNYVDGEKDESKIFRWKVNVFPCTAVCDLKTRLEKLIGLINPRQKVSNHRPPYLVDSLASALRNGPSLLYLDNAYNLTNAERQSILEAVDMARETQRVGVVMSTLEGQPYFDGFSKNSRALAEVWLSPLQAGEDLLAMTYYDPRFNRWCEGYKSGDGKAKVLAKAFTKYVDGNFDRLVQLKKSLEHHIKRDSLTSEDILRVIALRTP